MTTPIPIPQSPAVDARGYPTREWYIYWQQPAFQSVSITGTLGVASGGTGLSQGVSGGVLAFASPTSMVSSGTLGQYEIVFGGGAGRAPTTALGLGTNRAMLIGNAGGYPNWYTLSDSPVIRWGWDDQNKTITPYLLSNIAIDGIDSVRVTGNPTQGSTQIQLVNDALAPGNSYFYGTNASGAKGWNQLFGAVSPMLVAGTNIILTPNVSAQTITISASSGTGVLPVVTGGVQNGQPTFVYFDDGSLMYAEAA